MPLKSKRIAAYEIFRVFFIVYIVLAHLILFSDVNIPSFTPYIQSALKKGGAIGVSFFFILSGLGCTLGYRDKLINGQISRVKFFYRRLINLWPAHLFFLFTALWLYSNFHVNSAFYLNFFMLQSWIITQPFAFSYNGVSWCISCLFLYYLIYCFFIYKLSLKENLLFTLLLIVIVFFNTKLTPNDQVNYILLYTNPYFRFLDFIAGVTLGIYLKKCNQQSNIYIYIQIFALILMAASIVCHINNIVSAKYFYSLFHLFPILFLLYAFYFETKLSKLLFSSQFLVKLSGCSIIIYLCHQEFWFIVKTYLPESAAALFYDHFFLGAALGVLVIIGFSYIFNKGIIRPIYTFLIKYEDRIVNVVNKLQRTVLDKQSGNY